MMKKLFSRIPMPSGSPACSLKQIPTTQLRPGMYLVRIVDSWWKSPFFLHRRTIQSLEEVHLLLQSGIRLVEIDVERGLDVEGDEATAYAVSEVPECLNAPGGSETDDPGLTEEPPLSDAEIRECASRLRTDLKRSLDDLFEGLKTGRALPMASVHQMADTLIHRVSEHPVVLTEVMLLEHLETYDKTLHAHVLDVAILSLLVGMQLEISTPLLHEVAVAGLLHDVGFLRLPANVVKDSVGDRTALPLVLRQHVNVGVALLRQHAKGSSLVHRLVGEHHETVDGSGYPRQLMKESISEAGQLLGLVDYFDELVSAWGCSHPVPPALALRRIFQEVREGRFPSAMGEALVRTLGVYPVGTVVQLTSGEMAVVASHQAHAGVNPVVLVVQGADGQFLDHLQERDLRDDDTVSIEQIVQPTEVPISWQAVFAQQHQHS